MDTSGYMVNVVWQPGINLYVSRVKPGAVSQKEKELLSEEAQLCSKFLGFLL